MTINIADNSPRISYSVASGVTQTSFAVPFEFFDDEDLNVYVDGVEKSLTTDFTVSGGDGSTGTVTISVTGGSGGSTVVITRDIPLERTTDFPVSGAFNIVALNTELDRLVAVAADLDDLASRAITPLDYDPTVSYTLPTVDDRKGKTLAFNETTGSVQAGPSIADTQSVADASADIALLADIQDGTVATNAITTAANVSSQIATLGAISSDITTVSGISSNVTTVASNDSNVTTVAGISSNVTTVADNIADINTVADDLNEAVSEINTVATDITNVNTVGTNIANVNTTAGSINNVNTVASDITNVNTVSTNISNVNTVAGISANVTTVAGQTTNLQNVTDNLSAIQNAATNATNAANSATAAAASAAAAALSADTFDDTYLGSKASNPSTDNDGDALNAGDLYFNTTSNTLKVYSGSAWQDAAVDSSGFVQITGDTMTGDLDIQGTLTSDDIQLDAGSGNNTQIINYRSTDMIFGNDGSEDMRLTNSGRLGIGTSSPASPLTVSASAATVGQFITSGSSGYIEIDNSGGGGYIGTSGNNMLFLTSTSGTERMRIDSSGNVGIGTSSMGYPAYADNLTIADSANAGITIRSGTSNEGNIYFSDATGTGTGTYAGYISYRHASNSLNFGNGTAIRMTLDSSGNVGIGTSSPSQNLHIKGTTNVGIRIEANSNSASIVNFADPSDTNVGQILYDHTSNYMRFNTNDTEAMRIDSSGRLLVGTTGANGIDAVTLNGSGYVYGNRAGGVSGYFDRGTSDGDIMEFRKDGAAVGSIAVEGADLVIGTGVAGLRFFDSSNAIIPRVGGGGGSDGDISLGLLLQRFDDIYATNGTIQTSDQNEKQDIAELSDAEQRVAVAAKGLLRKFRWKDAVAEKGDEARIHFGIIAQDLQAAFAAEGLDAGDYAMFISSTWTDEETGEERTRMGVRYSELLAFIIAAI